MIEPEACEHLGLILISVLVDLRHPDDRRTWTHEICKECGAARIAENEYIGSETEDLRTIAATPWRGGESSPDDWQRRRVRQRPLRLYSTEEAE